MKVRVENYRPKIISLASPLPKSGVRVRLKPGMNEVEPEDMEEVMQHPVCQAMYEAGDFGVPEDDGKKSGRRRKKPAGPKADDEPDQE